MEKQNMNKKLALLASLPLFAVAGYAQVITEAALPENIKFQTVGFTQYLQEGVSGESIAAPAGTWLWYIQDTGNDGFIGEGQTEITITSVNQIFNRDATGDFNDFIMLDNSGVEMGAQSTGEGRTINTFTLGAGMNTADDVYALLWLDVNGSETADVGDTLGYLNLGNIDAAPYDPGLREYVMGIDQNIYSGDLTVVPEPTTYALVFGLTSLAGVVARRRFLKK
jgi:hypothetical protein